MKHVLLALLLLLPTELQAASRVWIAEFSSLAATNVGGPAQIASLPALARQQLDVSGGVQTSAVFSTQTRYIRIVCEVQCAIRGDGTAAATDTVLPALFPEYFGVAPSSTISVIAAP